MISPSFQIKPMKESDNLAMDNAYESDEDLPLVIDCSYENNMESSPVIDDVIKLECMESESHIGSINGAGSNDTNEKLILLRDNDFNYRKCSTTTEDLGYLDKNAKTSPPIKIKQEIDREDHIEMKSTYPSEDGDGSAQCDIKIEYNELSVEEEESSESVDNDSGETNGMNDNLSIKIEAEASSNDSQTFNCDICPYKTSDETYFAVHKKTHRNTYRCNACFYVSTSAFKLLHHQKKRHMTLEELLYYCGDCQFSAMRRVELVKHRREKHKKSDPVPKYKCSDCSYTCCRKIFYSKHRVKEHKDILFKCGTCPRQFLNQDDFEEHSLVHMYKRTEEGLYKCKDCNYLCKNRHIMVYHGKMFHKTEARDKEFTCELCDYKTTQGWRLEQHLQRNHQGSEEA